ncbi:unnamed protein product [Dracunculus medinensis]|uniref:RWD domain-containing protein n=1 Tax=Dracunculus medinensis TaxID=318479 RepID=A0A0N4UDE8_DRAME|nr:unnamed protein product [Dracunculus medinensis]
MDDEAVRLEEIQSIEAIFSDIVFLESETRIVVKFDSSVQLTVDLPFDYPSRSPPSFEFSGPSLTPEQKRMITNELQEIYMRHLGEPVLYQWIEYLNRFLEDMQRKTVAEEKKEPYVIESTSSNMDKSLDKKVPPFISGDVICDRKSTFQAHVAAITSEEEAMLVLNKLKENGKIARATHNIYAWNVDKIVSGRLIKQHDCEDDGETGAGAKLLNLLDMMKARNVIVIVTRWYGGIHLGPDRFRHICNVAREILLQNGFSNRS